VAAPRSPKPQSGEDLLRQTQTVRALSLAKSIDDVSESVAETLFNDAELDLLTAAFASSAGWPDTATQAPAGTRAAAKPAASSPPGEDDLLGLLGLGDDAPLELLDEPAEPATDQSRKTVHR
jgi:hypothetical protein